MLATAVIESPPGRPCNHGPLREPVFTETLQIALVVSDLEASLRIYADEYGIGPWEIYEFNPGNVSELHPAGCAWRLAVTMVGSVQWELIQPLDDRSIYAEFLATRGEGVHHVAVGGRPYREELEAMQGNGRKVLQGGLYNGVRFSYLSTADDLGVITEIFEWPEGTTQEPDSVYPA